MPTVEEFARLGREDRVPSIEELMRLGGGVEPISPLGAPTAVLDSPVATLDQPAESVATGVRTDPLFPEQFRTGQFPGGVKNVVTRDVQNILNAITKDLPRLGLETAKSLGKTQFGTSEQRFKGFEELGTTAEALGGGIAEAATEIVTDPVGTFKERPVSTLLDVGSVILPMLKLGAVGAVARLGAKTGRAVEAINSAASFMAKTGDISAIKSTLRDLGLPRGRSKAIAGKLKGLTDVEDVQRVLAQSIEGTRSARAATHLAGFRKNLAEASLQDLKGELTRLTQRVDEAARIKLRRAQKAGVTGEGVDLVRESSKQVRLLEQARDAAAAKVERLKAVPSLDDISTKSIDDAVKASVEPASGTARSLDDVTVDGGQSRYTPGELSNMPLVDPYAAVAAGSGAELGRIANYLKKVRDSRGIAWKAAHVFTGEGTLLSKNPAGRKFAERFAKAQTRRRMMEAEAHIPIIPSLTQLNKGHLAWMKENWWRWVEDGSPKIFNDVPVPDEIVNFHKTSSKVMSNMYDDYAKARRISEPNFVPERRPNYWRMEYTGEAIDAMIAGKGELYEAMVQAHPATEFAKIRQMLIKQETAAPNRLAHSFDTPRELELLEKVVVNKKDVFLRERNPVKSLNNYINQGARRTSDIEHFGMNSEGVLELLGKVGQDPYTRSLIRNLWQTHAGMGSGKSVLSNPLYRFVAGVGITARTAHLSGAFAPNLTGTLWTARKYGMMPTLRGMRAVAASRVGVKDAVLRQELMKMLGAYSDDPLRGIGELEFSLAAGSRLESLQEASRAALGATGLGKIEGFTNQVTASTVIDWADNSLRLFREGGDTKLRQMLGTSMKEIKREFMSDPYFFSADDVERMAKTGMTRADKAQLAQAAPGAVNAYRRGLLTRPLWTLSPYAQPFLAYTSWVQVRGKMMAEALSAATRGNISPLARELGYSQLGGESARALRTYMRNRQQEGLVGVVAGNEEIVDWDDLQNILIDNSMEGAQWGMAGALAEGFKWARGTLGERVVGSFVPPMADFVADFVTGAHGAIKAGMDPGFGETGPQAALESAGKSLVRAVPGAAIVQGLAERIGGALPDEIVDIDAQELRDDRSEAIRRARRK